MSDELSDPLEIADSEEVFVDPVAERTRAYCMLLKQVKDIDGDLRKEGEMMLSAVRRSFKQIPVGDLRGIDGGKQ